MYTLFTEAILNTIREHWDDVMIESYSSHEKLSGCTLASDIMEYIDCWKELGIFDGSKIAICAPYGLKWSKLFLAITCSSHIAITMPSDIESAMVASQHSECDIMYIQSLDYQFIDINNYSQLRYIISIDSNEILWSYIPKTLLHKPKCLSQPSDFKIYRHNPDDLALIIYTSGTATRAKGVMLSYKNLSACLWSNYSRFPYERNAPHLSLLPLNHIFGLMYDLLLPVCKGMLVVVLDRPPIPEYIIPAIKYTRPIMLFTVPIILYKLMEEICKLNEWGVLSSCKMITCGGSGVRKDFSRWMIIENNLPFNIGYGMSECSPSICIPDYNQYEIFSCGKPIDCLQFKIDSEDPSTIPGEIFVKGDSVFMGYYKDKALTQSVFTDDGWFKTGDIAFQSKSGNVYLCGRKDSQLSFVSGKNVLLDDIEEKLRDCASIEDVVLSVNNDNLKATIVPKDSSCESSIRAFINEVNKSQGVFISEIQFEDTIKRTEKGSIKRSFYK